MLEKVTNQNAIDLMELGLIQISGKDAKLFLQGQLTCNLEEINAEQSRLGAHCDVKGRIIAIFRLFFYQNEYYFLLPHSIIPLLLASLKKYAVFSKVALLDVSQDWNKIGIYGAALKSLFKEQKLSFKENSVLEFNHSLSLSIPEPVPRAILLTPITMDYPINFIENGTEQQNANNWHLFDIMAGIPTIYPETSGQFTPHQLNLPKLGAVSFNKGCYLGQEIITRTHFLGNSKSHLYQASFQSNSPPLPGTPLLSEDEKDKKGTLIVSAKEGNHYRALVCLQTKAISHTIRLGCLEGPKLDFLKLLYST